MALPCVTGGEEWSVFPKISLPRTRVHCRSRSETEPLSRPELSHRGGCELEFSCNFPLNPASTSPAHLAASLRAWLGLLGKSGVSSSFLPEKTNRHRIMPIRFPTQGFREGKGEVNGLRSAKPHEVEVKELTSVIEARRTRPKEAANERARFDQSSAQAGCFRVLAVFPETRLIASPSPS